MNPNWQDKFCGHFSQGCPQAFPIVAQQSCLVQTTPSNCPEHVPGPALRKQGPVL